MTIAPAWIILAGQTTAQSCLPTCEVDGRFFVVAGNDPTTLATPQLVVDLSFPKTTGSPNGNFDLFDGDSDATRWDVKSASTGAAAPQLDIELYADPEGTGTGGRLIRKWAAGDIVFANSDWTGVTWPHDDGALTAPGADQHYRYALKISAANAATDLGWNAFKVRAQGTIELLPQAFGFIASLAVPGDVNAIYPKYPALTGSTYDGTWSFKFRLPAGLDSVTLFDGDMDFGDAACSINDTDDRDTKGIPAFGAGAVAEGVAATGLACTGGKGSRTGLPDEDNTSEAFRRIPSLAGSPRKGIVYKVVAPDGQSFLNRNPSGNREWEQFKILKVPTAGVQPCPAAGFADHDCETTTIPEGVWEIVVDGMDLLNLNFFSFTFKIQK